MDLLLLKYGRKVIQSYYTRDDRAQGLGKADVAGIGDELLLAKGVIGFMGMEGLFDVARRATEIDLQLVRVHTVDSETLCHQPRLDGVDIAVQHAERSAELLRRQPLMKVSRTGSVLLRDESLQLAASGRAGLEDKLHVIHPERGCHHGVQRHVRK